MLLGNRSVLLKSPGRFLSGTIASAERSNFFRPGNYRSAAYEALSAVPYGYVFGAWHLPLRGGALSSINNADVSLTGSASGLLGFPISGSTTLTISVADAAGELIVSGDGTATITLTGESSLLTAVLNGVGTASFVITGDTATLGAEASLIASSSFSITGTLTPYAIGHMSGAALAGTELSPDNLAQSLLDLQDVENSLTVRQALRLIAAAAAAKVSGAGTTTVTIRNAVADSKNRIVATVDADGNRSAITYDLE